nr:hypothetical protein [Rhodobaculum claviforme]
MAARDRPAAEAALAALMADLFGLVPQGLAINADRYSLNSLNGTFDADGRGYFFKFHQEDGEEEMTGEYYRADILARAGLPVDRPLHVSRLPGEQVLVYARRSDPRASDVLLDLDHAPDPQAARAILAAEAALNAHLLAVATATLRPITPEQSRAEPIHRLFHQRLVDPPQGAYPGGRLAAFYVGRRFDLPGLGTVGWDDIAHLRPVVNGTEHRRSLAGCFDAAHRRLAPERLADAGGIVAHGDAHNANVWYEGHGPDARLTLFDPAFAGDAVPSLLAEVKATFHNTLAHPFWLYDPATAARRYGARVAIDGAYLRIDTDWAPNALRRALLGVKRDSFWRPWIAHLAARDLLPDDWSEVIRLALFLSPTLVMNLRADAADAGCRHTPVSSAIGLGVALAAGSAPVAGPDAGGDPVSEFLDAIAP